ncbi:hypothetical protein JB92DRAFT_1437878 [Gautieria morchelliformis]|nr:hypothetical protein JB92DRAFT_1437878 [Gautieria morchelliformis]
MRAECSGGETRWSAVCREMKPHAYVSDELDSEGPMCIQTKSTIFGVVYPIIVFCQKKSSNPAPETYELSGTFVVSEFLVDGLCVLPLHYTSTGRPCDVLRFMHKLKMLRQSVEGVHICANMHMSRIDTVVQSLIRCEGGLPFQSAYVQYTGPGRGALNQVLPCSATGKSWESCRHQAHVCALSGLICTTHVSGYPPASD